MYRSSTQGCQPMELIDNGQTREAKESDLKSTFGREIQETGEHELGRMGSMGGEFGSIWLRVARLLRSNNIGELTIDTDEGSRT